MPSAIAALRILTAARAVGTEARDSRAAAGRGGDVTDAYCFSLVLSSVKTIILSFLSSAKSSLCGKFFLTPSIHETAWEIRRLREVAEKDFPSTAVKSTRLPWDRLCTCLFLSLYATESPHIKGER